MTETIEAPTSSFVAVAGPQATMDPRERRRLARASGKPRWKSVIKHVLLSLGMTHDRASTLCDQPLPDVPPLPM